MAAYSAFVPDVSKYNKQELGDMVGSARYKEHHLQQEKNTLQQEKADLQQEKETWLQIQEDLQQQLADLQQQNSALHAAQDTLQEQLIDAQNAVGSSSSSTTAVMQELVKTLTTHLSSSKPRVEKYYDLPKVMDHPSLEELRTWMEELETYTTHVPASIEQGVGKFLQGRIKGHLKRVTDGRVKKLQDDGSYTDTLETYFTIWRRAFGLMKPDDYAREKMRDASFTGGSLSEHVVQMEALFNEMVENPMAPIDKVLHFLATIKDPALREVLEINPLTALKWEGPQQWDDLSQWVLRKYNTKTIPKYTLPKPSPEKGTQGSHQGDAPQAPLDHGNKRKPPSSEAPKERAQKKHRPEEPKFKTFKLPPEVYNWYREKKLCFRCGAPASPQHEASKCTQKPRFPKDLPLKLINQTLTANGKPPRPPPEGAK